MAGDSGGPGGTERGGVARDWRRTHTCGELRSANVGQEVVLNGWVDARRDLGGIYFVELRDRYGTTQIVLDERHSDAVRLAPEFVVSVRGQVVAREPQNVNTKRPTGEIEVQVAAIEVLAESPTPPFEIIDDLDTAVETRLRYRYLDLRRPKMQRHLAYRSRFINSMRRAFEAEDFVEVETPILTKSTPEGARDYLVPSRVNPGTFYALPQSPQIFKQLLMVSGLDKYFQVARCFRDEDLRADRQPDFTQLDMEMSFVEEADVFGVWERVLARVFAEVEEHALPLPFPRLTYAEAMARYGSDKPDTRFGLELQDIGDWARGCSFGVFTGALEAGGSVLAIVAPEAADWSRKQVEALEKIAKEYGAKGLAWWKAGAEGGVGPLARFVKADGNAATLMERLGAPEGALCLFAADRTAIARRVLGELRLHLGRSLGLVTPGWNFLWVTEFPLFLENEGDPNQPWASAHHPFTAPIDWSLAGAEEDPGGVASRAYDLVLNGWELGSGSIRIHRPDVQQRVFEILRIGAEEQQAKFGFLLDALKYGAPPHGGFALGLDRVVALLVGLDNIRDVVAFPKTTSASDLMCGAPSAVPDEQLGEVHIGRAGKALEARPR